MVRLVEQELNLLQCHSLVLCVVICPLPFLITPLASLYFFPNCYNEKKKRKKDA